jgi:hypothetical protein
MRPADRAHTVVPTIEARARPSADFLAEGSPSARTATPANGGIGPFAGQVIPDFSGMLDNGDGSFLALPDNGFGSKTNSTDFLPRLYQARPRWETSDGGPGTIDLEGFIQLRDHDRHVGHSKVVAAWSPPASFHRVMCPQRLGLPGLAAHMTLAELVLLVSVRYTVPVCGSTPHAEPW